MAEAFTNRYGKGQVSAQSAGIRLADKINPAVVAAMAEKGIDISSKRPKMLTNQMIQEADLIITMGCGAEDLCPGFFLRKSLDWKIDDPKGKQLSAIREIRDEIEERIKQLFASKIGFTRDFVSNTN